MAKKQNSSYSWVMNPIDVGLACGLFMGAFHLLWVILVALGAAQALMDWILSLHFIELSYSISPFNFLTALVLVVFTAFIGFIAGYLFGIAFNYCIKKKS